ncbi:HK97-gp10 family putative phage morphogenesis protein [Clostridium sp. AM58-1XD]|uniref:HK97-gp10 family putative phage morphogenesis protein n=1 Tax=Clostridium sp. AM58-1XD TaxID=2292307 RepID=UPI000E4C0292|nr:HK97-gp10 family putative phage morphogenesis protein [Clostridium sp. AM58-1XD]RGY95224.1 HK97 gp10 family phage protein [Clostridium sp. AM58-1XD]
MAGGIEGLDKLMKKYGQLAEQITEATMEKAVGASAITVQKAAKDGCPSHDGELKQSILTSVQKTEEKVIGTIYTNKPYAGYVEMGTGPKGEANHSGISPLVSPAYTQEPWWIHESQIDRKTAETYQWHYIDTPDGRFYRCEGQAAQPYLYPALKNNKERVTRNISNYIAREIRRICND